MVGEMCFYGGKGLRHLGFCVYFSILGSTFELGSFFDGVLEVCYVVSVNLDIQLCVYVVCW